MMYFKPKRHKKHRATNSVPTFEARCEVCGKPYAETHEIFYGTGHRQLSIKYGIQALLCAEHHRGPFGPHQNRKRDLELKQRGQKFFEMFYTREEFMKIFGRSYL